MPLGAASSNKRGSLGYFQWSRSQLTRKIGHQRHIDHTSAIITNRIVEEEGLPESPNRERTKPAPAVRGKSSVMREPCRLSVTGARQLRYATAKLRMEVPAANSLSY